MARKTEKQLIVEFGNALKPYNATYGWPEKFDSLPIVTYSLAGQTDKRRDLNNLVVGYSITYNVDIWCKTPEQCIDMMLDIEGTLAALGYVCVNQGTMYEDRSRHHLRATAEGYYDEIQKKVR